MMNESSPVISLTNEEKALFETLLSTFKSKPNSILRVCGGWVRDKLLGLKNDDIDITINDMSAEQLSEFLASGSLPIKCKLIKANPLQHKYFDTATLTVNNLKIEMCSLRPRNYTQITTPQSIFGTAEDDALGRDFTINALFYNINRNSIEDWTKLGLQDLRSKLIRTPLDPKETLTADPLRCLRAIRFAAKTGFLLSSDLKETMKSSTVQSILNQRISRERIWNELEKILKLKNPLDSVLALETIISLNLTPILFAEFPGTEDFWKARPNLQQLCLESLQAYYEHWMKPTQSNSISNQFSSSQNTSISKKSLPPSLEQHIILLSALLLPLCQDGKSLPITKHNIMNFWKFPALESDVFSTLIFAAFRFSGYVKTFQHSEEFNQLHIGLLLKDIQNSWITVYQLSCVHSFVFDSNSKKSEWNSVLKAHDSFKQKLINVGLLEKVILSKQNEQQTSDKMELDEEETTSTVENNRNNSETFEKVVVGNACMSGDEMVQLLSLSGPSPTVGVALRALLDFQIMNPRKTIDECKQFMLSKRNEFVKHEQDNLAAEAEKLQAKKKKKVPQQQQPKKQKEETKNE